jgi:hypothetical protein
VVIDRRVVLVETGMACCLLMGDKVNGLQSLLLPMTATACLAVVLL